MARRCLRLPFGRIMLMDECPLKVCRATPLLVRLIHDACILFCSPRLQLRILAVPAPEGWVMARNLDGKQGLVPEGYVMVKLNDSSAEASAHAPAEQKPATPQSPWSRIRR